MLRPVCCEEAKVLGAVRWIEDWYPEGIDAPPGWGVSGWSDDLDVPFATVKFCPFCGASLPTLKPLDLK